jgi:AraC-like DNA-binding protein
VQTSGVNVGTGTAVMLSVPFPVITLLALFLLLAMALFFEKPRRNGTLRFLTACIILFSVSTLRWEYDSTLLRNLQSGLAILLPFIAWHSFISVTEINRQRRLLQLLLPPSCALLIRIFWPPATDFILFLLFSSYGVGLLRMVWLAEHSFRLSRLRAASYTIKMTFFAGCFLCLSGVIDLAVIFDFSMTDGERALVIIVISQITLLPLIGGLFLSAGRTSAISTVDISADIPPARPVILPEELEALYARLETQVRETQIYLNPDLSLNLLARKTGIPARQVSGAINALSQNNLSQWINGFRIERAKALLLSTSLPVTDIMLESGFITKSNFNREFQRITGVSPTGFRQQAGDNPVTNSETG